jgi:TatD DNase family protein
MIDTHCHIDLYSNPIEIANECEANGIITIGMTNLPSHFEIGYKHLQSYTKVRLALGMHPLHSEAYQTEFPCFLRNISNTSYIGEIGLDFSREGIVFKDKQILVFNKILKAIKDTPKVLSLHSRKAEKEVLETLIEHTVKSAVFHWYSGPLGLIREIIEAGYYFSLNPAMIGSKNGQAIIGKLTKECVLTESDGPFIRHKGRIVKPEDVSLVISYLSNLWQLPEKNVQDIIHNNFRNLISNLKKT